SSPDTAGTNIMSAFAISADFSDTILISNHLTSQDTNISSLDAKLYPYIQLVFSTQDSVLFHPGHINYWRVLYEGYPEMIINPEIGFEFIADTLFQGSQMSLSTFIENVSDYTVDSLSVSLRIISEEDNTTEEINQTISHLNEHSFVQVSFDKATDQMEGDYKIVLIHNSTRSVKEENYNNNIGILPMHIEGDQLNPVLDVTFDGHHILDGDLVASRPLIVIQLHDENEFLRLDDTSSFSLFLRWPSDFTPRHIPFSSDWVHFNPAGSDGQNLASVELRPELLEDGPYILQIRAEDATGNPSGDNDYMISFVVINAESISYLYNYPNPFSTSTRFVYTLTGQGSPPHYKIQIMSISGKVVREITQQELGLLTVGTHMTDFVWDGTDENGDRLAAGTYLYRMIVKNNELGDFDHYETAKEQTFFNKGWGKLVILR
ncbi:MAG TPA: FlgD immunoglobulin-like domain containing protein, partial [Saprospiraceae bacterium]|nr:FlgD immunoglobulin-like domain containing protein [Saprospiraceae bacterium]